MELSSKVYTPYRSLGLISNHIPLIVRYVKKRKENLIITVIGNAFHTYEENKLRLINVGNPHSNPIICLSGDKYHVYTACLNKIFAWRRTTELIHTYDQHASDVFLILPFGPHLIAVDKKNILYIWNIKSEERYLEIEFPSDFKISSIVHPATYINKILLGSEQGKLQLWNVKSNRLIYTFKGWNSEVKVLEQAPAQDVIAIGLANGEIYLHNLKFDESIVTFKQDWGTVTALSFRTDGIPIMVSGSELGHIAIWDLNERRLSSQLWEAHKSSVTGLSCLLNEPRMVTSSADNTLKMWIFDMPDGGARLQNFKEGHSAPPLMARFHGALGNTILTAGEDATLRHFSTVTDLMNKSLGQASYNKKISKKKSSAREKYKMPAITAFTSEATQEKPWDNIACIHRNIPIVTSWSFEDQKMGEHKLAHNRFKTKYKSAVAVCLDLSFCGNYIVIGYNTGHLDKYNIQSAIWKGSFQDPQKAHDSIICGVVTDALNQVVVSGDQNGFLKWWKFKALKKFYQLEIDCGISNLRLHRDSGLLILILEDWTIQVADIDTKGIIRKFNGHSDQVIDSTFSSNSKWIVTASLDKTIRTWDLPSGFCVDMFAVPVAAISITFSPIDEFLATVHAGHLGVYLWANRTCFHHVSLSPLPNDFVPPLVALPSVGADDSSMPLKEIEELVEEHVEMEVDEEYKSPSQISEELITLALLPNSRWLNLLHIDIVKKRNKPIEPPKIPKAAPFFIPTVPGLDFKFGQTEDASEEKENFSKLKDVSSFEILTPFTKLLKERNYDSAFETLMHMGPSSIDAEIKGLDPDTGGSEELILSFLKMLKQFISKKIYFEAAQGYLSLTLKIHADFITGSEAAQEICEKLLISHSKSWRTMQNNLNQSLSLISYLKNAAVINY